jgi:hypothetical protein
MLWIVCNEKQSWKERMRFFVSMQSEHLATQPYGISEQKIPVLILFWVCVLGLPKQASKTSKHPIILVMYEMMTDEER